MIFVINLRRLKVLKNMIANPIKPIINYSLFPILNTNISRVETVEVILNSRLISILSPNKLKRNRSSQMKFREMVKLLIEIDPDYLKKYKNITFEAGHIIGYRFGGPFTNYNLIPMTKKGNRNFTLKFEDPLWKYLSEIKDDGSEIYIKFIFEYSTMLSTIPKFVHIQIQFPNQIPQNIFEIDECFGSIGLIHLQLIGKKE